MTSTVSDQKRKMPTKRMIRTTPATVVPGPDCTMGKRTGIIADALSHHAQIERQELIQIHVAH